MLLHDRGTLKVVQEHVPALEPCIGHLANLVTIESLPALSVEAVHEKGNGAGIEKVDECVTNVALVLEVHREIEKIIAISELGIKHP